jgi:hypothetical protein
VTRRKNRYGIKGSGATTKEMPELDKRQAVFDQLAKDPNGKQGPRSIKEGLAFDQGIHLTRYTDGSGYQKYVHLTLIFTARTSKM